MIERKNSVLALITSYNPDERLEQLVLSVLKDPVVSRVLIYDNNSMTGKLVLQKIRDNLDRVIVHYSSTNDGLGRAFNTLINDYWLGENFIITFDQDSKIQSNCITQLQKTLSIEHLKNPRIVSIGPRILAENTKEERKEGNQKLRRKTILITSGNLFLYDAYKEVLGFDETYFIDCLDYEFCLRLRSHGYKLIQDRNIFLYQDIGEEKLGIRTHSNFRMYYMFRNHIRLTKTYFLKFPIYITLENLLFLNYFNKWRKHNSKEDVRIIMRKAIKEA
ncbi:MULTISPECIES: glycosyltransferase [Streptococcus]|uniref:glycosyltransferase n=1 Tax=Streptococcus TaxID=1301 RepID=UPI0013749B65|nr:glycosyltransferase [Streptococcus suis]MBM7313275.1 glycosyltransferase [Streptococcus suis]